MKQIIFKFADDPRYNVAEELDVEYIKTHLRENMKNREGYYCLLSMLCEEVMLLMRLDYDVSKMYEDKDSIVLFVEVPEYIEEEYEYIFYEHMRECLNNVTNLFAEATEYYNT